MARLADRQHRVQVDVRVDQWRRQQPAGRLDLDGPFGGERAAGPDRDDPIALDGHVDGLGAAASGGVDAGITNQEIQRLELPPKRAAA